MSDISVKSDRPEYSKKQLNLAIVALLFASMAYWFTRFKALSILPTIAGDLNGMKYYSWATMMFMLCATIVAPLWGKVSDIFGRKSILALLIGLMIIGDMTCAFAPNIFVFIVGFAICGLGGGGMQGIYYSLLGDLFAPDKRGKYGGMIMMLMGCTQLLLPLIAALITKTSTWRNVFFLTSSVYVIALVLSLLFIPAIKKLDVKKKIDFIGTILLACAVVPFLLALSWGGSTYAWNSPRIIVMLVCSVIMLVVTYFYEKHIPDYAVISIKLLKNSSFMFSCLVSMFMAFSMSAVTTYLPLFCEGVQKMSVIVFSTVLMPASIFGIFAGGIAGWLMDKTKRYKWLMVMAPTSAMIVCVIYGLIPASTPIIYIVVLKISQNVFGASYMPSINPLAAMAQIQPEDFGVGTGTLNFITNLGNAIAPALLGSVLNGAYAKNIVANTAAIASNLTTEQTAIMSDARILVNAKALDMFKGTFGSNLPLFEQTVQFVRDSLQGALSSVFLVAAGCVFFSIVFALCIKEIPLDQIEFKKPSMAAAKK